MLEVLLGLALGVLILLAMPFDVAFHLTKDGRLRLRLSVAWAFGLISKELGKTTDKRTAKRAKTKAVRHKQKRTGRGKARAVLAFLRSPGMAKRLLRLARGLWRQLRVRRLYLHLTFGLDDPADTGRLFGVLAPAVVLTYRAKRFDLRVQPNFTEPVLQADGRGQIRLIPLTMIGVMLAFLLSPTCWRGFAAAARAR